MASAIKNYFTVPSFEMVKDAVESKYYTIRDSLNACCNTDCKIYAFVIAGRLLQAISLTASISCVAAAIVTGPIALTALVPSAAAFLLGHFLVHKSKPRVGMLSEIPFFDRLYPRTFIPGQPVGLKNFINKGGNTCWINAFLQCVVHCPELRQWACQVPELEGPIEEYLHTQQTAQATSELAFPELNAFLLEEIRNLPHDNMIGNQTDATLLFEWMVDTQGHRLYDINYTLKEKGEVVGEGPERTDIIRLPLYPNEEETVQQLFRRTLKDKLERNQQKHLQFQELPETLVCYLRRYTTVPNPRRPHRHVDVRIDRDIHGIDAELRVPCDASATGETARYKCNAFIVQRGGFAGGHYVAYVEKDGVWWYCNDATVTPVTPKEARNRMKECYLFFCTKKRPLA
jgi:Ubiquitin carboxyl-terminal hydrolase